MVIIEGVTTAGTSIRETMPILQAQAKVQPVGLVVSVDRMEYSKDRRKSALQEIGEEFGLKTASIVTMEEVTSYLYGRSYDGKILVDDAMMDAIRGYYEKYGVEKGR